MKIQKENKTNDVTKTIRILCVLAFAILLQEYSIGNLDLRLTIVMTVVVVILFIVNAIPVIKQNHHRLHEPGVKTNSMYG